MNVKASRFVFLLFSTAYLASGDLETSAEEGPVTPVHLVGHEDTALLDRVQDLIDDWDPRKLVDPLVVTSESRFPDGRIRRSKQLRRSDLASFIADVEAAEALGKAFFWDMQAGSDFRRLADGTTYAGTACASCHYRNGADARSRHTARIPYVVWDKYQIDQTKPLEFGEKRLPFEVKDSATREVSFEESSHPFGNLSLIVGSAGVESHVFDGLNGQPPETGAWESEKKRPRNVEDYVDYPKGYRPDWSMFVDGQTDTGRRFRQITARNSPSVINAGFADRLFHDGRAESTFNGFSIFGDRDQRSVLYRGAPKRDASGRVVLDENGVAVYGKPVPVHVAITKAALASQAVGPIVNDLEMSYLGRSFPNLACKLLDTKVLGYQIVSPDDSVLGPWQKKKKVGIGAEMSYRDLIRTAFRREWWDGGLEDRQKETDPEKENEVPLKLMGTQPQDKAAKGPLMVANFSLYWGLSIMIYESSLVSNQSPFDAMMQGNPELVERRWETEKTRLGTIRLDRKPVDGTSAPEHKTGTAVFQHGFRVFLNRGCIECHSGPLFSEIYDRLPESEKSPIYERISQSLLPNSKADAIAVQRDEFLDGILGAIASDLAGTGKVELDKARQWASEFNHLREQATGNKEKLKHLIELRLVSQDLSELADSIANRLMIFEKTAPIHYGQRTFFNEDERVSLAEQILDPLLVEKMPIPPKKEFARQKLPIKGPQATEDYAFYDLGFYAIGVSPPRYDPGIGDSRLTPTIGLAIEMIETELKAEIASAQLQPDPVKREADVESLRIQLDIVQKIAKTSGGYEKLPEEIEIRLRRIMKLSEAQTPQRGNPGSAYRLAVKSESLPTPEESVEGRKCHEGPAYDPDETAKKLSAPKDRSWIRIDLPEEARRSSLHFLSRARTLVSDEEPWGYRKPLLHDNEIAFWGAFKTPSLRNVELTTPYMHNGRIKSLADVIEFYDDGGFIAGDIEAYPDKHPSIVELDMSNSDKLALEFFLICLTDERVRREQAPFDHPSLQLVHGYDEMLNERIFNIPAIGQKGWTEMSTIPPSFPDRQ